VRLFPGKTAGRRLNRDAGWLWPDLFAADNQNAHSGRHRVRQQ